MIRKAVIPAAGLGTRFLPATKAMPKEMLPIIDKPIIQYVVEEAIASGIEDIIIITGRGKRAIEDYFDASPELELHLLENEKYKLLREIKDISSLADIHYIRQKEPKGLGDAVLKLEEAPSNIGTVGRYVLAPEIFDGIKKTSPGKGNEIQLTDAIRMLIGKKEVYAFAFSGKRYDAGDKFGYVKAIVDFALERGDLKDDVRRYLEGLV